MCSRVGSIESQESYGATKEGWDEEGVLTEVRVRYHVRLRLLWRSLDLGGLLFITIDIVNMSVKVKCFTKKVSVIEELRGGVQIRHPL